MLYDFHGNVGVFEVAFKLVRSHNPHNLAIAAGVPVYQTHTR